MATKYMALDTINTSDYVSPTTINNNFTKLDPLGLDYVTARGTSGEWWYRKWKSGRAECGIDYKSFGTLTMREWGGGGYITSEISFGAYPFAFAVRPYASVVFEGDSLHSTRVCSIAMKHSTSTTTSPTFVVHDGGNSDMQAYCGIKVEGRYK